MKKMVATIATGIIIAGSAATSVAAAEYTVQSGDSLWKIANNNNTTVNRLVQLNNLKGDIIYPEQKLQLDGAKGVTNTANTNSVKPTSASYKVKRGDSLSKIAQENGVTVASLQEWNGLSGSLIYAGQTLYLEPGHKAVKAATTTQKAPEPVATKAPAAQPAAQKQQPTQPAAKQQPTQPEVKQTANVRQDSSKAGKKITVSATAYTAGCKGCSGITATGINLNANPNAKVIAVDPSVIPLGSKVEVPGYGTAIAGDTGGAIKGNKIDIHVPSHDQAVNWGRRSITVTIVE